MTWTTPVQLRNQVERLWARGDILRAIVDGDSIFPRRLTLKTPTPNELSARYGEVRAWLQEIRADSHYRLVERRTRFRSIGENDFPVEAWIDTEDDALSWLGKRRETEAFRALVDEAGSRHPSLLPWIAKQPLGALALSGSWRRLLDVVDWCQAHPRPGVYIRQVDIPGVDTKFIETHRGTLYTWLNLALPLDSIHAAVTGASQFNLRFGFREKPRRVRFRVLDLDYSPLPDLPLNEQDFTLTDQAFSGIHPIPSRVFVTENEINFLAFPPCSKAWILFGSGYGFDAMKKVEWMKQCEVHYWGDLDTHGFAALDQFRADFPEARSFLMDEETLLGHTVHWTEEPSQAERILSRLTKDEHNLFGNLLNGRWGKRIRLEQERVSIHCVDQLLLTL